MHGNEPGTEGGSGPRAPQLSASAGPARFELRNRTGAASALLPRPLPPSQFGSHPTGHSSSVLAAPPKLSAEANPRASGVGGGFLPEPGWRGSLVGREGGGDMKERRRSLYCRELNRIVESRGESVVQGDFVIRFQSSASNPRLQAVEQGSSNVCKRVIAYG